jgi:hypothetical protein
MHRTIWAAIVLATTISFAFTRPALAQTESPPSVPSNTGIGLKQADATAVPPAVNGFAQPLEASPPPEGPSGRQPDPDASPLFHGGAMPLLNPTVGHAVFRADYRATWLPDQSVIGQPARLGYLQQEVGITGPIWQDCSNEWTASLHVGNELFHTLAVFPDSGQPFPQDLWNIRLATSYRHLFENGWIAGATVSVGSASDRPFNSINEMTAGINAFLRVPSGDHNAWLFSLSYSSNSELPIPIPGVAYVWQVADNLVLNLGLPFMVLYRPTDDLTLECSYMLISTVHARATYRLAKPVRIYAGYDWGNESYLPANRLNDNDRLFYYSQRLTGGVKAYLSKNVSLDLSGGYVFDRYYFEGHSISDSNHNRINVGDGPFLSLQCQVWW